MFKTFKKNKSGFSLIELIVIIAVIVILSAFLVPSLVGNVENSHAKKDNANMENVVNAVKVVLTDYDMYKTLASYTTEVPAGYKSAPKGKSGEWSEETISRGVTITFYSDEKNSPDETTLSIANAVLNYGVEGDSSVSNILLSSIPAGPTGSVYEEIVKIVGKSIKLSSDTYRNSNYTIFIEFGDNLRTCRAYGQWSGKNLDYSEGINNEIVVIPPDTGDDHIHDFVVISNTATCTNSGMAVYHCSCGEVKTEEVSALGHNYNSVVTGLTCTSAGIKTYTCNRCNHAYTEEVSALGHNYNAVVTDPICTEQGYTTHTCLRCGDAYVDSYVDATGHSGTSQGTTNGYTTYKCNNCSRTYGTVKITSGNRADIGYTSTTTDLTIPATVTKDGVTYDVIGIGDYAFQGCTSLENVIIPNGVTSIGAGPFANCTSLTNIEVDANNANYCDVDGILFNKDKTELIQYLAGKTDGTYDIPDSVITIGEFAFYNCDSLESITIPNSMETIGNSAFAYCASLENITIPSSVKSIGKKAFHACGLTNITIASGVKTICDYAFQACTSLENVTIPDSVTNIGEDVFSGCSSLTSITVDANNNYYCDVDGVLFSKDKTRLIKYAAGKTNDVYDIPDGVIIIDSYAFYNCTSLTSVTIPEGVTSIGNRTFYNCTKLESVTIPNGVTTIGAFAFCYCYSLTSVTIPDSVISINQGAFQSCAFESIIIPASITSIKSNVFQECRSLTSVTIPNSVTSIDGWAFYACSSLTNIYIDGTKSQWNAIAKGTNWNYGSGNYTIHCTDGDIAKS